MASSFSQSCPVLWFRKGAQPAHWTMRGADGKRGSLWIALPIAVWPVNARLRVPSELNAFERAILAHAELGIVRAADQAKSLGLDPELVAFVLQEQQAKKHIDQDGQLTEVGRRVLQGDRHVRVKTERYYVFQDPFADSSRPLDAMWPWAVRRLEYAPMTEEPADTTAGNSTWWPRLDESTPARDLTRGVKFIEPRTDILPTPRKEAVARAMDRWLAGVSSSERKPSFAGRPEDCISLAAAEPELMWVLTQVYVPDEELLEGRWRIANPFAPGDAQWLRTRLHALRNHPEVVRRNGFTHAIAGLVDQHEVAEPDEAAEYEALARFGAELTRHPVVHEHLIDLLAAQSTLATPGKQEGIYRRARSQAARSVGILLEHMLRRIDNVDQYPLYCDVERAREMLEHGIPQAGWGACPRGFCYGDTDLHRLKRGPDLRDLMARSCLRALPYPSHPLRSWLQKGHELQQFDALRAWRNQYAHAPDGRKKAVTVADTNRNAQAHISNALDLVECVLPHLPLEP